VFEKREADCIVSSVVLSGGSGCGGVEHASTCIGYVLVLFKRRQERTRLPCRDLRQIPECFRQVGYEMSRYIQQSGPGVERQYWLSDEVEGRKFVRGFSDASCRV